jgi:bacterioferritin
MRALLADDPGTPCHLFGSGTKWLHFVAVQSSLRAMLGEPEILEMLNDVLTAELTAINQYFLDAKMLDNWGYLELGRRFREDSIDEMHDAESLIDRILYLDGHPNLQRLGVLRIGETPTEKLEAAASVEREAIERLNRAVELSVSLHDTGSRELFAKILTGEEEHLDWLETQLHLVSQLGEVQYLAEHIHKISD